MATVAMFAFAFVCTHLMPDGSGPCGAVIEQSVPSALIDSLLGFEGSCHVCGQIYNITYDGAIPMDSRRVSLRKRERA